MSSVLLSLPCDCFVVWWCHQINHLYVQGFGAVGGCGDRLLQATFPHLLDVISPIAMPNVYSLSAIFLFIRSRWVRASPGSLPSPPPQTPTTRACWSSSSRQTGRQLRQSQHWQMVRAGSQTRGCFYILGVFVGVCVYMCACVRGWREAAEAFEHWELVRAGFIRDRRRDRCGCMVGGEGGACSGIQQP